MDSCKLLFLILFMTAKVFGSGMPVLDINEMTNQLKDATYLLSSIETLIDELGANAAHIQSVASLSSELQKYQRELEMYQQLGGAIEDASEFSYTKSKVLVDQINSISNHIRKMKTILLVTGAIARPEAVSASMKILSEQREREAQKFKVAMAALDEQEKIRSRRRKLLKKIRLRQALQNEMAEINNQPSGLRSVQFSSQKRKNISLW